MSTRDSYVPNHNPYAILMPHHAVLLNGQKLDLTSMNATVLSVLARNLNKAVHIEDLSLMVWGMAHYGMDDPYNRLYKHFRKIRQVIAGTGLELEYYQWCATLRRVDADAG